MLVDTKDNVIFVGKGVRTGSAIFAAHKFYCSDTFYPSEIVQFDEHKVLGLVTAYSSSNLYTVIVEGEIDIPVVI